MKRGGIRIDYCVRTRGDDPRHHNITSPQLYPAIVSDILFSCHLKRDYLIDCDLTTWLSFGLLQVVRLDVMVLQLNGHSSEMDHV